MLNILVRYVKEIFEKKIEWVSCKECNKIVNLSDVFESVIEPERGLYCSFRCFKEHNICCNSCKYFTNNSPLHCAVHPKHGSRFVDDCSDYTPRN